MNFKERVKEVLKKWNIPVTKNLEYDILTERIIKRLAEQKKVRKCVDVGVLDGDILKLYIKYLPGEAHYAFEPIPHKFKKLQEQFGNMNLHNCALADEKGEAVFNYVVSNPSYSGLKQRKYPKEEEVKQIRVQVDRMENRISKEEKIDLIKIDVEGAEYGVLKGADRILREDKPYLIFEFGLGASDFYGTTAKMMWDLLTGYGYRIFLLKNWAGNKKALSLEELERVYKLNKEYYFIAEQQ